MDFFWLIPVGMVVVAFVWVMSAYLKGRPSAASDPRVLVDKPSDKSEIEAAAKAHDWHGRPCGSFMEWLHRG